MKISVKGIYSTGLIQFLRENRYTLTKLSEKQKERFGICNEEDADIYIRDLKDKTGVSIVGKNVQPLIKNMKEEFWDSFYLKVSEKNLFEGKYIKIINRGIEFETISEEKRIELLQRVLPLLNNIGVYFKETCEQVPIEEIIKEFKELLNKPYNKIEKWYVYFGYESKKRLDYYRKKVINTIENHHIYRRDLSDIVDFSEILLEEIDPKVINKNIKKYIIEKIKDREIVKRYHRKPNGYLLKYIEFVKDIGLTNNNKIWIKTVRVPRPGGMYDGLNLPKEPGDYIITTYLEGSWYFTIEYYNKSGALKGRYINVNTPIEITSRYIQYLDLEIDVIETDNRKFIVDREELETYYNSGIISERLYCKALEISKVLLNSK